MIKLLRIIIHTNNIHKYNYTNSTYDIILGIGYMTSQCCGYKPALTGIINGYDCVMIPGMYWMQRSIFLYGQPILFVWNYNQQVLYNIMIWKERLSTRIKHIWQMVLAMDSAEDNWTVPQELQGQPYAVSFILALP